MKTRDMAPRQYATLCIVLITQIQKTSSVTKINTNISVYTIKFLDNWMGMLILYLKCIIIESYKTHYKEYLVATKRTKTIVIMIINT